MTEIFSPMTFPQMKAELSGLFDQVQDLAIILAFPFFVFSLVIEQFRSLDEKPEYFRMIKGLVLFFIALALYDPIFVNVNEVASQLATIIFSESDFQQFQKRLLESAFTHDSPSSFLQILRGGISYILLIVSYFITGIAFYFLDLIRRVALGFLYVMGPLWLVIGVLPHRSGSMGKFFQSVIVVNAWVIIANLLMKIQSLFATSYYENIESHLFPTIASNIVLGVMLLMTPKITSSIASMSTIGGLPYPERAFQKTQDVVISTLLLSRGSMKKGFQQLMAYVRKGSGTKSEEEIQKEGRRPGEV